MFVRTLASAAVFACSTVALAQPGYYAASSWSNGHTNSTTMHTSSHANHGFGHSPIRYIDGGPTTVYPQPAPAPEVYDVEPIRHRHVEPRIKTRQVTETVMVEQVREISTVTIGPDGRPRTQVKQIVARVPETVTREVVVEEAPKFKKHQWYPWQSNPNPGVDWYPYN